MLTVIAVFHTADVLLICPDKITASLSQGNKVIAPPPTVPLPSEPLGPGSVSHQASATAALGFR